MKIFPAIDIKDGKCVRLLKGDFNKSTEYEKSPLDQATEFTSLGYKNLHIVDLDGAMKGNPINGNVIRDICKIKETEIQVGGGIRSIEHIKKLIDYGADKIILGTVAIENIKFLEDACSKFKNKIAISLDVREGCLALRGWKKQTDILASEFVKKITIMYFNIYCQQLGIILVVEFAIYYLLTILRKPTENYRNKTVEVIK